MFSEDALRQLAAIDGISVFAGDNETGEWKPVIRDKWCSKCERETVTIGASDFPRRCPRCGYTENCAHRIGYDLEERSP